MSTIQNSIKHIKSSLEYSHSRDKTMNKTSYNINNVVVNGVQLPSFAYGKLSLQKQTKNKKIKQSQLRTLQMPENRHIFGPELFKN